MNNLNFSKMKYECYNTFCKNVETRNTFCIHNRIYNTFCKLLLVIDKTVAPCYAMLGHKNTCAYRRNKLNWH